MKKTFALLSVLFALAFALTACAAPAQEAAAPSAEAAAPEAPKADQAAPAEEAAAPEASGQEFTSVLKIGASPVPHAEILEFVKPMLAEQGIDLQITEYSDYIIPNTALESRELDANYFQHLPYLKDFNAENKTHLVSAAEIHFEPLGIYPGKVKSIEELGEGATIAVPNDPTNEARALLLLEAQGLIKIKEGEGLKATPNSITENPKNIKFVEVEAAAVPRTVQDVDVAVINGNYALQAGFTAADVLASESSDSEGAQTYANVVAVYEGDEASEAIQALVSALKSDETKKFIEEKYQGSVVPMP